MFVLSHQEMTIPWCLKRAELVFKCVKGNVHIRTSTVFWMNSDPIVDFPPDVFLLSCLIHRLHDGDGLLGWRNISHSSVFGTTGENLGLTS